MKTKLLIAILALGWLCSEIALAQAPDTLFISTTQVVHIRFGSELKYVNLGNKAIVAKIVDGSKDYVAVKAREPFDICTSMSCLESTGAMHTFLVAYREHPQRLDVDTRIPVRPAGTAGPSEARPSAPADTSFSFSAHSFQTISEMPKELYHIGAKDYGIEVFCDNLLVPFHCLLHQERLLRELRPLRSALCHREQAQDQTRPAIRKSHLPKTVLRSGCNSPRRHVPPCFHLRQGDAHSRPGPSRLFL